MELWVDAARGDSDINIDDFSDYNFSRIWSGSAPDVAVIELDDHHGQDEARSLIGSVAWILVRCSDWTMIPLENLVAAAAGSGTRIAAAISEIVDLGGAAFALEHGVDGLVMPLGNDDLWTEAANLVDAKLEVSSENISSIDLVPAKITAKESGGVGERVCVDLIERLSIGEGMVVGSSATAMALIHGETIPTEFVPTRPFRIGAGAVHAYCLMADDSTKYLSELVSGDEVAIISATGQRRSAFIGRLKIERRPFLILRFEAESTTGQVILQQAETVRLVQPSGSVVSITDISIGDEIMIRNDSQMRHVGIALAGEMNEK